MASSGTAPGRRALSRRVDRLLRSRALWQGVGGLAILLAIWQAGGLLKLGMFKFVPTPLQVLKELVEAAQTRQYWQSWYVSGWRVLLGYAIGVSLGVPLGLAMGINRTFHRTAFPVMESPAAHPTAGVGAAVHPVLADDGADRGLHHFPGRLLHRGDQRTRRRGGDRRQLPEGGSLDGSAPWHLFWRVVLPATAPSIFTGMAVGMGLTWEIVVAAEMIASIQAGLGFMMWQAYVGGAIPLNIVAMISIGVAGLVSSTIIWGLERRVRPWRRRA